MMTTETRTDLGITLSMVASQKIRELLEQEGNPDLALRVYVAGGGCSGLQYGMALDDNKLDDDHELAMDGIRVLIDAESSKFLVGPEIDYVDSLMGAGFTVNNPMPSVAVAVDTRSARLMKAAAPRVVAAVTDLRVVV